MPLGVKTRRRSEKEWLQTFKIRRTLVTFGEISWCSQYVICADDRQGPLFPYCYGRYIRAECFAIWTAKCPRLPLRRDQNLCPG